jgi:L-amino acid N-acyltransferase YncA
VNAIHIHPRYWRKGLGTLLYNAILKKMEAQYYKEAYIWIARVNNPARLFFESLGCKNTGIPAFVKYLQKVNY